MVQPDEGAADERLVVLGRVGRVHGVKGWVRLASYTAPPDALLTYKDCQLYQDDTWRPVRLAECRVQGKTLVARFAGVDDRDAAAALTGADIGVPRERLPEPGDGHYYWVDLEGSAVRHLDGRVLGTVERMLDTGAHDVMVVRGEREVLIPFVMDKVVLGVDLAKKVIDVDWEWD